MSKIEGAIFSIAAAWHRLYPFRDFPTLDNTSGRLTMLLIRGIEIKTTKAESVTEVTKSETESITEKFVNKSLREIAGVSEDDSFDTGYVLGDGKTNEDSLGNAKEVLSRVGVKLEVVEDDMLENLEREMSRERSDIEAEILNEHERKGDPDFYYDEYEFTGEELERIEAYVKQRTSYIVVEHEERLRKAKETKDKVENLLKEVNPLYEREYNKKFKEIAAKNYKNLYHVIESGAAVLESYMRNDINKTIAESKDYVGKIAEINYDIARYVYRELYVTINSLLAIQQKEEQERERANACKVKHRTASAKAKCKTCSKRKS